MRVIKGSRGGLNSFMGKKKKMSCRFKQFLSTHNLGAIVTTVYIVQPSAISTSLIDGITFLHYPSVAHANILPSQIMMFQKYLNTFMWINLPFVKEETNYLQKQKGQQVLSPSLSFPSHSWLAECRQGHRVPKRDRVRGQSEALRTSKCASPGT